MIFQRYSVPRKFGVQQTLDLILEGLRISPQFNQLSGYKLKLGSNKAWEAMTILAASVSSLRADNQQVWCQAREMGPGTRDVSVQ
jgi:hypothetical protein